MTRVVIAGGGLAGCLAALALDQRRPEVDLVLVDQGAGLGGNHTWSFFDSDVPSENRWLIDDIARTHWPEHQIRFPRRKRTIPIGYNSIRSEDLDRLVQARLSDPQVRLGQTITAITATSVTLESGETIEADAVIDARGPRAMPGIDLGWQKFVGRFYRFPNGHGLTVPTIMDGTVEQSDGYRFIYRLPMSATEVLIEDTYYSTSPDLDRDRLRERCDRDAETLGDGKATVIAEEEGVLPVVMSGDVAELWAGTPVPRLGLAGGFFHPTTGYSLPDAIANAILLADQARLDTGSLHALFKRRAERLWSERKFFMALNRMLFLAAEPGKAYRVLEHFYRLSPGIIARFYAARLTGLDTVRVLTGRPPVPIARALGALRGRAA